MMMSNELVVIEKENALAVLSDKSGVEKLIDDVRERVMSMEGGSLKTGVGRKQIKSNAFKATKAKTAINEQYIQPLIDQITDKIQPDLDTIQSLKDNKKILNAGLDQIRKDVNAEVTAIEDEIKRKEEEAAAKIEAERIANEVERDHEMALLMDADFNRQEEEKRKQEEEAERLRLEAEEKARIEREEELKRQAAEAARLEAEQKAKEEKDRLEREKQEAIEREEAQRQAAIQAELEAELAREEAERQAKLAEEQRIKQEEEAKRQAELAEQRRIAEAKAAEEKRLADIEAAKQAEIAKQEAEKKRLAEKQAEREANRRHVGEIRKQAKEALMAKAGLTEEQAKAVVLAISKREIAHCEIKY